jgi:hypothetical protein
MERPISSPPDFDLNRADINQPTSSAIFLTEIDAAEAPVAEDHRSSGSFFDGLILLLWGFSIGFLIVLTVRRFIFSKRASDEESYSSHNRSTSCARCRYFNRNPYIKCAVNPLSVQKIDANDCPDFCPEDND